MRIPSAASLACVVLALVQMLVCSPPLSFAQTPLRTANEPSAPKPAEVRAGSKGPEQPLMSVPAESDVLIAKKKLGDVFVDDFNKANREVGAQKRTELSQLAGTVAELLLTEDNPITLYAIYIVAIDISKRSGDVKHVSKLIESFEASFAIDGLQWRRQTFKSLLDQVPKEYTTSSERRAAYIQIGEHLASHAATEGVASRWEEAQYFYDLTCQCFQKAGDKKREAEYAGLMALMLKRSAQQKRINDLLLQVKNLADPSKPNLEIGSFYCFELADWSKGLPYLRDSSDQKLSEAAKRDLSSDVNTWEAAGDLWWDVSGLDTYKAVQSAIRARAATFYLLAIKDAKGLSLAKIKKRLREAGVPVPVTNPVVTAKPSESVEIGLKWLARQQRSNGSWSLVGPYSDPASAEDTTAATSLALLAFLGSGFSPTAGEYKENVKRGLEFLVHRQNKEGFFADGEPSHNQMYSNALASLAVLKAYPFTKDEKYKIALRRAIAFAEWSQSRAGGWRYEPREDSDTSVTGWYVAFLTRAKEADFDVKAEVLDKVGTYLDSVSQDNGSRYIYQKGEVPTLSMSAEAFCSRLHLGWPNDDPALLKGVNADLLPNKPQAGAKLYSVYFWFHGTEVLKSVGGKPWMEWRDALKQTAEELQDKKGSEVGSWEPSDDQFGTTGGRLYVTCLILFCLQAADTET